MNDKVWDLIFSLIDESDKSKRKVIEKNQAFIDDVSDIVDSIEDVAVAINLMIEDGEL